MPGFIYDLYRSQPARMTLSIVIFYCAMSYLAKMVLKFCLDFAMNTQSAVTLLIIELHN